MRVGRSGPAEGECPVPTGVECRRAEEEGGGVVVEVREAKDSTRDPRLKQDPGSREWSVLENLTPPPGHLHVHLDSDNLKHCLSIMATKTRDLLQDGGADALCSSYVAIWPCYGADLRNVVTEAGLFAIKDYRDAINQDDFNKAVRKVAESKKLEGKIEYAKI
ncbi:26S proteasome subunit rpt4 [Friedmanniomyces endolithicus]|uniref:26S proteasome subunit rpt4 n=1 Tax=Friedmanniomyces endolithicus TaxID=329885 RepID=A0AAN6FJ74_9PEZI|nr:26S proteasome subunit rpt4 [Friedmanniomyces endolithicus]